jgi:hypothetical protein
MKLLKGNVPTELEISEVGIEIQLLSGRRDSLLPHLREVFVAQLASAIEQLRMVRADLEEPRQKINSSILRKLINKRWEKLNATLLMAEAYCS